MDLNLLRLFLAVAETTSFSAAARKLGLPKSSVSRGVASLENSLGTQLLHRTTRQVSLTTAGTALYDRAAPLMRSLDDAVGALPEREEEPSGELRITAPNDVGAVLLPEIITKFTARYPRIRLDVRLTNRPVDLVAEGFDVAIRAVAGRMADTSLVARKLTAIEIQFFASPSYLARRGTPRSLEELADHDWVLFRSWKMPPALAKAKGNARIVGDDMLFLRNSVIAGGGVGILPAFLAHADVTAGNLVRVVPRYTELSSTLIMLYPQTQHVPRKVTALRDFLLEALAARPLGGGRPPAGKG